MRLIHTNIADLNRRHADILAKQTPTLFDNNERKNAVRQPQRRSTTRDIGVVLVPRDFCLWLIAYRDIDSEAPIALIQPWEIGLNRASIGCLLWSRPICPLSRNHSARHR